MAKKKSKKRGWSGGPPARPSGASRPPTAGGGSRPAAKPAAARPAPQPTSNRTVRKEEARRQREILRRKAARQRRIRRYGIIGGIVVAAGAAATLILFAGSSGGGLKEVDPRTLPGITQDSAPWPPETANLAARIAKMGLPPLGGEAQAYHIHQNLAVYVNGTQEPVPTGLGLISSNSLAEIHTHDASGTIHVEAGATRHFTLGTVFDVWGVLFTTDQIGSYKSHGTTRIRVFSNGKLVRGNPTRLPLRDHLEHEDLLVDHGTAQLALTELRRGEAHHGRLAVGQGPVEGDVVHVIGWHARADLLDLRRRGGHRGGDREGPGPHRRHDVVGDDRVPQSHGPASPGLGDGGHDPQPRRRDVDLRPVDARDLRLR